MGCKPKISFTVQNISKGKFELETSNGGLASGSSHIRRNLVPNRQTASLENKTAVCMFIPVFFVRIYVLPSPRSCPEEEKTFVHQNTNRKGALIREKNAV